MEINTFELSGKEPTYQDFLDLFKTLKELHDDPINTTYEPVLFQYRRDTPIIPIYTFLRPETAYKHFLRILEEHYRFDKGFNPPSSKPI